MHMRRLQRSFELIATDRFELARTQEQGLGLFDQLRIPQSRILLRERHVFAVQIGGASEDAFFIL